MKFTVCALGIAMLPLLVLAQVEASPQISALRAETSAKKRYQEALSLADDALTEARKAYLGGNLEEGKTQIDLMMSAVDECVKALAEADKSGYYKKAELKVSALLRRLNGAITDVTVNDRGYLAATRTELQGVHERLLKRVMKK